MGWGASFVGLHAYATGDMTGFNFWTGWLVPGTFDGAAFGATLITYRASIYGRSALRGRLLMWTFTGISSWINWIHQGGLESQVVAAGLPIAAVAVFDVVLAEMRADFEERHGQRRFRLRPALLTLRWLVDRAGTAEAFRQRVTGIPVSAIAGVGIERHNEQSMPAEPAPSTATALQQWRVTLTAPTRVDDPPDSESVENPGRHGAAQGFAAVPAEPGKQGGTAGNAAPEVPTVPESAAERTDELPAVTNPPAIDAREQARALVRHDPSGWSGAALGSRFGMSERWGRLQIAAVREELTRGEQQQEAAQIPQPQLVAVNG